VGGRRNWLVRKKSMLDQGLEQPAVGGGVRAETCGGLLQRAPGHRRAPAVERMGVADLRLHQPHAAAGEVELPEERRGRGHRLHGRADVVPVAGAGELLGAHAAARAVGLLHNLHPEPGGGQPQRTGQPVRPRPDDDSVGFPVHW